MPEFHPDRLFGTVGTPSYVVSVMQEYMDVDLGRAKISRGHSGPGNPIVLSVVRNENERLPDFLRHYREAGIEKFVFIDNSSTDGTVDYLAEQPDVDLYRCERPFHWMKKHGWINLLLGMYGRDRWYIYADGDEHVVFDGMDEGRKFTDLVCAMERGGVRRVRGVLVDMYTDGPLLKSKYKRGDRLLKAYPYFDCEGYKEAKYREIISRKGGPRQRVFAKADKEFRPELTKYPIFQLSSREVFANPHHIWPYEENFKSDCYLGVLHFKFLPEILLRIEEALEKANYWDGSLEYRCYAKILREDPELSLFSACSAKFTNVSSLREFNIIRSPIF